MTFRKLLVLPVALLVAASTLAGFQAKPADLTGTWTGTLTRSDGQGGTAHLELKQKAAELTGTAGPRADSQTPIANGKVTTVKGVTSAVFDSTQGNGAVMKFDLKLTDGRLKGAVTVERNGQKLEAVLDVGRGK